MTALLGLAARLRTAKLHLVCDLTSSPHDLQELLTAALRGGVDIIQLRDEKASREQMTAALTIARNLTSQLGGLLVVGRDVQLAQEFGADLVHLGASDGPVEQARGALGEFALVGRSVHGAEELQGSGADYLFVGPVFGQAGDRLALVRRAAEVHAVDSLDATPWFAVGGITEHSLDEVLAAGAIRVAVTHAITRADDPQAAAAALKERVQAAWDARPAMERYAMAAMGAGSATFITQER